MRFKENGSARKQTHLLLVWLRYLGAGKPCPIPIRRYHRDLFCSVMQFLSWKLLFANNIIPKKAAEETIFTTILAQDFCGFLFVHLSAPESRGD